MRDFAIPQPTVVTNLTGQLSDALAKYEVSLAREQRERVEQYCHLLWDWNGKMNLTRHTDFEKFVGRDVIDTLQLANHLRPDEVVLDVGSGGGVPGMLLAILRPDLEVTLSESMNKKAAVLTDMADRLGLPCRVIPQRAEQILEQRSFDAATARAVGPMSKLLRWFGPHWNSLGRLLLIKGPRWLEERNEARHRGFLKSIELRKVASYPLVGTDSESVVLLLYPKGKSEPATMFPQAGP